MNHKYTRDFWIMCLGALLFFLSFNMVLPELPDLLRKVGGAKYLGWVISSFSIFALIARPFSGYVTDSLGRKWAMLLGTGFCVVAGCLYPVAGTVIFFFLIRAMHGFFAGFTPTGLAAFTTDIVPQSKRGEALGWQGMFSNIGASAGFAIGSALLLYMGKTQMFVIAACFAAVGFFLFTLLPETKPIIASRQNVIKGMFFIKAWKPAVIMFLVCGPIGAILTIMPDYTMHIGFNNKGLYLTVYIASSLFVRIFSGRLSDKFGRPFSTIIGSFCQILSMLLLIYFSGNNAFFLSAILYGFGQGFNAPALFAWAGDTSDETSRGRAMSMLFIALELGIIFGALSAGYFIATNAKNFNSVFAMNLFLSVVTFIVSFYFYNTHKKLKTSN